MVTAVSCKSCGALVIWATTERLRQMPVDAEPSPEGTVLLREVPGRDVPMALVLKVAERFGRTNLRTSHFATCPDAKTWRRRSS